MIFEGPFQFKPFYDSTVPYPQPFLLEHRLHLQLLLCSPVMLRGGSFPLTKTLCVWWTQNCSGGTACTSAQSRVSVELIWAARGFVQLGLENLQAQILQPRGAPFAMLDCYHKKCFLVKYESIFPFSFCQGEMALHISGKDLVYISLHSYATDYFFSAFE